MEAAPISAISGRRRSALTVGLLVGTLLASIEVTIVGAAMPSVVESLGGLTLFPWVFTAYLLTQTITIPLYGRLADLVGRRPTYVAGVVLFLIGSTLCGLAPSMNLLIAARLVQGLGAGVLLPLTMTIFGDIYPVAQRTRMQGWFSLVWGVSSVAGPILGGIIVSTASWRWIFFLNLPIGTVAAIMVSTLLPPAPPRKRIRLDLGGSLTLALAVSAGMLALLPPEQRLGEPVYFLGASAAILALFLYLERRHPEPMIPLSLFRNRVQAVVNSSGLLLGITLLGVVGFMPLTMRSVMGASPFWAGMALIPISVGWTTASVVAGHVVHHYGFRRIVRVGSVCVGLGGLILWSGVEGMDLWEMSLGMIAYGAGMGCCISSFTVAAQETAPAHQRGIATALTQFSRSIGGTIGIAMLGALMGMRLASFGVRDLSSNLGDPALVAPMHSALTEVFLAMALTGVLAAILCFLFFPEPAGALAGQEESP